MAEGAGLLNQYRGNSITGSNPVLPATYLLADLGSRLLDQPRRRIIRPGGRRLIGPRGGAPAVTWNPSSWLARRSATQVGLRARAQGQGGAGVIAAVVEPRRAVQNEPVIRMSSTQCSSQAAPVRAENPKRSLSGRAPGTGRSEKTARSSLALAISRFRRRSSPATTTTATAPCSTPMALRGFVWCRPTEAAGEAVGADAPGLHRGAASVAGDARLGCGARAWS